MIGKAEVRYDEVMKYYTVKIYSKSGGFVSKSGGFATFSEAGVWATSIVNNEMVKESDGWVKLATTHIYY